MGLNTEERNQLATTLYNYTEEAYAKDQSYREFLDHLILLYKESGLDGLSLLDRKAFLDLVEEAL